jgi:uncharacterized protein YjbI with pentapeptide repeats
VLVLVVAARAERLDLYIGRNRRRLQRAEVWRGSRDVSWPVAGSSVFGCRVANPKHLAKLKEGVEAWNEWRKHSVKVMPNLGGANLSQTNLAHVDLSRADLTRANLAFSDLRVANLYEARLLGAELRSADLREASLRNANLTGANLYRAKLGRANLLGANLRRANLWLARLSLANLGGANFRESDLSEANLRRAWLMSADLSDANLKGANLSLATLIDTNLEGATLTGCSVYGISAWNLRLDRAVQSNLVITHRNELPIQVDNLEVAQFIYLLLNNSKIRSVIDTITSKVVLILGRFTPGRKAVLDAIRDELRKRDYLPVLFDFEKPANQTTVETVSTMCRMARFVIADLTDARSVLQELQAVVPNSPSVPVQLILLKSQEEPGMLDFIHMFQSVLDTHRYTDQKRLLAQLKEKVIDPAEAKANELAAKRHGKRDSA